MTAWYIAVTPEHRLVAVRGGARVRRLPSIVVGTGRGAKVDVGDEAVTHSSEWNIRAGRNGEISAPPPIGGSGGRPVYENAPVLAAHAEGRWVAGMGWVAATHPGATLGGRRPRTRGLGGGIAALGVMRLVVSAVVGVVLFSAFGWHSWITDLFHGKHDVATPASIAGDPLVTRGPLAQLTSQVNSYMASNAIVEKSAGGFYAPPGATSPSYAVFGIQHHGSSMTQGDMDDVVNHISGGSYQGTIQSDTRDGVTYTCGNVRVLTKLGVACVWDDYNVGGFLVSFGDGDVPSVMALTQMARNAIEGTTSTPPSSTTSAGK